MATPFPTASELRHAAAPQGESKPANSWLKLTWQDSATI
jgi:hypothetical protein